MTEKSLDEMCQEYNELRAEAHRRYKVSNGLWECPEWAAVREALIEHVQTSAERVYYQEWWLRFFNDWQPLHFKTLRAQSKANRAGRAMDKAKRKAEAVTSAV